MKKICFLTILLIILSNCKPADTRKIEHLKAFAKAYGYVKYFHPSDGAQLIDWNVFSAYGAEEILKCRTKNQLVRKLNELFYPIAPSVKFIKTNNSPVYDIQNIKPDNTSEYRLTFWQHKGVSKGMINHQHQIYKSIRVNRTVTDTSLFNYIPEFGELITQEISSGIICEIPLALYCNDKTTFPKSDSASLKSFINDLKKFNYNKAGSSVKIGNIINVYNVFQHFFPYFDVLAINWDEELEKTLNRTFNDKSAEDHLFTLQTFLAPLKDCHINVILSTNQRPYSLPIEWEWVEDKLVITNADSLSTNLHIGDIVTEIKGQDPHDYFKNVYLRVSAGNDGWRNFIASEMILTGQQNSKLSLKINGKNYDLTRNKVYSRKLENQNPSYKKIEGNIFYLNMSKIEMDTIDKLLPQLQEVKTIICDARGYPKGNYNFINHLMAFDDTTSSWMQIPQIIYPDREKIFGYEKHNWMGLMKARKPYLGDKKIIYIIDGTEVSYAESCLGYIEGYKLAHIIGQPSAGTNGNINSFKLLGDYYITWTGMKVVKHDGSQHHGIGIIPDRIITKTLKSVNEGYDEFFEKALEEARRQ